MIKILGQLPTDLTVAVSGGVDSMAALDFLSRRHNVKCAFFHHGTATSDSAQIFLEKYCSEKKIIFLTKRISRNKPLGKSAEEFWRSERYEFLDNLSGTVITAHNLEDSVETWIWSSLNGNPKLIPYSRNNVIRPFITTSKNDFVKWCIAKMVPWQEDLSNKDIKYIRNYIRHELMPHALKVNPGLSKLIKKKIIAKFQKES